ncbi:MAG: flagellar export chaperone FliS [Phycisphaerales bacterium]|nr:flagellar export chaperone FliS [Phycisphaerales bacterium]
MNTHASQEYLKNAVLTASAEQLQILLFDGAIRFSSKAIDAIRAKDIAASYTALDRAQRIVLQITDGLNRDVNPALVDQIRAVLDFVYRRLIDANLHKDVGAVEDALRILKHQRETWVLITRKVGEVASKVPIPAAAVSTADKSARPQAVGSDATASPAVVSGFSAEG